MFSNAKVGDKVFDIHRGEGVIRAIGADDEYPVRASFGSDVFTRWYDWNGRSDKPDALPTLYWSKPEIIAPPQPKRMVKKSGWLSIYSGPHVYLDLDRGKADTSFAPGRKALIFIEWEEEE